MAKANLIQKINKMDRKQAYTIGAIAVVVFISLITLASFMGKADDNSFDGFSSHGYDLANMPFVNDEAEAYLLASKYPDMQDNNASLLYSPEEKEERQEEDAEGEYDENYDEGNDDPFHERDNYDGYGGDRGYGGGRGYGGRGGGGSGGGGGTSVGQLGQANVTSAHGSGVSSTFGAPRGDFSPYKSQDKGTEVVPQLRNTDARKALSQFAQTSRAAAGLKDGKGANAKRATMGGNIQGSDAFTETGVDLSKSGGLNLDTNAPEASPSLDNLDKDVGDAAKKAKEDNKNSQSLGEKLLETFLNGMINMGVSALGNAFNNGIDSLFASGSKNGASKGYTNDQMDRFKNMTKDQFNALSASQREAVSKVTGVDPKTWTSGTLGDQPNLNAGIFDHKQSSRNAWRNKGIPELDASGNATENTLDIGRKNARNNADDRYYDHHQTSNDKKDDNKSSNSGSNNGATQKTGGSNQTSNTQKTGGSSQSGSSTLDNVHANQFMKGPSSSTGGQTTNTNNNTNNSYTLNVGEMYNPNANPNSWSNQINQKYGFNNTLNNDGNK